MICFASAYEGFGMPIVEAQAIGRPVVTSYSASMPEVAGGATVLVDPFCVEAIKAGVVKVISDHECRDALIDNGFMNVNRFRAFSIAEKFEAIYADVEGQEVV